MAKRSIGMLFGKQIIFVIFLTISSLGESKKKQSQETCW